MIGRIIKWLVCSLLVLTLLLTALLAFLLASEPGNRWLLARLQPHLPGTLVVSQWQGHLFGELQLRGVEYRQGELHLQLDRLDWQLQPRQLLNGWLHLQQLRLGELALLLPPASDKPDDEDSTPVTLPDSLALPFGIRIDQLSLQQLTLNGSVLLENLHGDELAAGRRLNLPRLQARLAGVNLDLSLSGELSAPYPVTAELRWQMPLQIDGQEGLEQAAGQLALQGPLSELRLRHQLSAPLQLHSQGTLELLQEARLLSLDLRHQWPEQALPITLPQPITLGKGQLHTQGDMEQLELQFDSALTVAEQPLTVQSRASYQDMQLTLASLQLQQGEQQLNLSGQLALAPLAWALNIDGNLNPQLLHPQLPGLLKIAGHSKGRITDQGWQLDNNTLTVDGELRQQPLKISASVAGNQQRLTLNSNSRWGDNRINAAGHIGNQLKLDADLQLARLADLDDQLSGQLDGQLQLRGSQDKPLLSGNLTGQQLGWQAFSIDSLQSRFSELGLGARAMTIHVQLDQLQQDRQTLLDSLALDGGGSQQDHHLAVQLGREQIRFSTRLDGGLSEASGATPLHWQGQISDTQLSEETLGQWQQQQASALRLSANEQQLAPLCLSQNGSELCLNGRHGDNGAIAADLNISALPLALANSVLGGLVTLQGTLSAELAMSGSLDDLQATLAARTDAAAIDIADPEQPQHLPIEQLSLDATLQQQQLAGNLTLRSALADISARLENGLDADAALDGELVFTVHTLEPLALLSVDIRDLKGDLAGALQLAGSRAAPRIQGRTSLTGGSFLLPTLGTDVQALEIIIDGDPDGRLNVDGSARLGDGELTLSGHILPLASPLGIDLRIQGERLMVANRPDAKAWISPDITVRSDQQRIAIRGRVDIPEAAIAPTEIPEGAITVSEDQVLIDEEKKPGQGGQPVDVQVALTLGDKVSFTGFGLTARLGGDLEISQRPEQPVQLNGEFLIHEGRYRAYGQNLAIEDGMLIFQGPPDNPGLDLRAIRRIPSENLVVGVYISGTLQDPRATIFSDPTVEQSQAMAYLISGRSLDGGSDSDNAQIAQALALYGLEQGSGLTRRVGDTLGLDQITIGSDWETDDAALMLGKQISDRLYLTYAVGLFEAISTVMLRYTLSRQLHLEAQSSTRSNSIDLIWQREFK